MRTSTDMRLMLRDVKHYGLEGLEPYSGQVQQYMDNPAAVKKLCAETGVTLVDVGDLPRRTGSAPWKGNPWLGGEDAPKLVAEMESFARTFLQPMGCTHWKNNMGARPEGGPSDDQLKRLAATSNEIGRKTTGAWRAPRIASAYLGPMEREHEFRRVMELTDPRYVFLIMDTGHNVLGGMDVVKITAEFLPRIAEFHLETPFRNIAATSRPPRASSTSRKAFTRQSGRVRASISRCLQSDARPQVEGLGGVRHRCAASRRRHRHGGRQYRRQRQLCAHRPGREAAARQW